MRIIPAPIALFKCSIMKMSITEMLQLLISSSIIIKKYTHITVLIDYLIGLLVLCLLWRLQ